MDRNSSIFSIEDIQHGIRISEPIHLRKVLLTCTLFFYLVNASPSCSWTPEEQVESWPGIAHFPQGTRLPSYGARKCLKLICLPMTRKEIRNNAKPSFWKFGSIPAFTEKGKVGVKGWLEIDLLNMADELSFSCGLSLNSNLCVASPCLLKYFLYGENKPPWKWIYFINRKNQIIMEPLNQCY